MPYSLGVDIGSTYTAAALWRAGSVQSVPLGNRSNAVPSVLFLREDGTLLVGEAATRRAVVEPDRQARDFKRRMGDDVPILLGDDRRMSAQELTGHLLRWVVDTASEREGERPGHLVLTHPAEWGDYRRGLLVEAAATAGLPDVGLLPEPVAAAAWYAAQDRIAPGALVGVYDLGGGTFDASVVRKTDTGFEVFGEPGGDETIGGLNFDHLLLRYVAAAAGLDLGALDDTDPAVAAGLAQLRDAVVDAKEALSADVEATIPVLLPGHARPVTISRTQLEALVRPQILGTVQLFGQIVNRAGVEPGALHGVLLVGGSSRIPLVAQLLRSELGARVAVDAHPKYAVSLGAAITSAPHLAAPAQPGVPAPAPAGPGVPPGWPAVPPVVPSPAEPGVPPGVPAPVGPGVPPGWPGVRPGPPVPAGPGVAPGVPGWAGPTFEVPAVPAMDATVELRPVPATPEAGAGAPTVVHPVNLAATGLTAPTDVPVVVPRRLDVPRPRVTDRDEPVVVRTGAAGSGYWGRGLRTAVVVVVVIGAVVAGVTALVLRGANQPRVQPTLGIATTAAPTPSRAAVEVTGQVVADPPGTDAMRAVTALPSGDLVAVGLSVDRRPRAWLRRGTAWRYVAPPVTGTGGVSDVAGSAGRVVAVGWSKDGSGSAQHPAVWTSTDGESWKSAALSPDLQADGIVELTSVVAATGGGFLATGDDRKTDKDGDVALFRSPDGVQWHREKAEGLDGPGTQVVHRMAVAGTGYVAVGSALTGARLGPAVWTSGDELHWQPAATRPPGSPTLWSVIRQPDGSLLSCGSAGSVDSPAAGCWVQRGADWVPLDVTGAPTALYIYGLVSTASGVVAVGVGRDGATVDATVWLLRLPPS